MKSIGDILEELLQEKTMPIINEIEEKIKYAILNDYSEVVIGKFYTYTIQVRQIIVTELASARYTYYKSKINANDLVIKIK